MSINESADWRRTFYGGSEKDMKDKELLESLGYFFEQVDFISKQYPIFYLSHKEEL